MTKLTELSERLEAIAETIDENSYMHPLCAHDDVLLAAEYVRRLERTIQTIEGVRLGNEKAKPVMPIEAFYCVDIAVDVIERIAKGE